MARTYRCMDCDKQLDQWEARWHVAYLSHHVVEVDR